MSNFSSFRSHGGGENTAVLDPVERPELGIGEFELEAGGGGFLPPPVDHDDEGPGSGDGPSFEWLCRKADRWIRDTLSHNEDEERRLVAALSEPVLRQNPVIRVELRNFQIDGEYRLESVEADVVWIWSIKDAGSGPEVAVWEQLISDFKEFLRNSSMWSSFGIESVITKEKVLGDEDFLAYLCRCVTERVIFNAGHHVGLALYDRREEVFPMALRSILNPVDNPGYIVPSAATAKPSTPELSETGASFYKMEDEPNDIMELWGVMNLRISFRGK